VEFVDRLAMQPDGKIIVVMWARKAVEDGVAVAGVARLNTDGTLDTSWGTNGYVRLAPAAANAFLNGSAGVHVVSGGKVIVAFASANGITNPDMVIYRLDSVGQVDTSFGAGGSTIVPNLGFMRLEFYPDDRMLATGNADPVNLNKIGLVRLNADGSLDTSFGTAGRADILVPDTMQLPNTQGTLRTRFAADGKIFVAYSYGVGSARDIALYKLTTSGAIDTSWGTAGRINVAPIVGPNPLEDNMRNMRVQLDGKILLMSRTERTAGSGATGNYLTVLTRLNPDGTLDTLFGTAGVVTTSIGPSTNLAGPLQLMADGKILIAGRRNCGGACVPQTNSDAVIVRYNSNGSLDTTFGTGGIYAFVITANFENIGDLQLLSDGTIVAGGQVSQFDADRGNGTTGSTIDNGFVVKVKNTLGPALVNLTVNKSGAGTVTSSPAGIDCGATCLASFATGSNVTLTATGTGGSTFTGWTGGGCPAGTAPCVVSMAVATTVTATFAGGAPALTGVVSRKSHPGNPTPFDVVINRFTPILGSVNVEPRAIGAGHNIVFQFDGPVAAAGTAAVVDAGANPAGIATAVTSGNDVVVTLTGVADNKRVTVSLTGGSYTGTVSASMGFLVGDFNGTRSVNAADISAVKARIGASLTSNGNPAFDVNVSGGISSPDVSAVKARSGLLIP
jgi:uncharacterized delta-60 repeat protein